MVNLSSWDNCINNWFDYFIIWIIIQTRTIDRLQMYEIQYNILRKNYALRKKLYAFSKVPKPSINSKLRQGML